MSIAPDVAAAETLGNGDAVDDGPRRRRRRKGTSQLKDVPESSAERERVKAAAEDYAAGLDHSRPLPKADLERHGRILLEQLGIEERFLGFAMVLIGDFFWKREFLATPFERRLLLLRHCLKHAEGCPADYDEFGLDCEKCGACSIADYKVKAEQLGYRVLVAEGSPIVLKIIISGYVDAILGVACLNVLEKAIDKVLVAGVPSYAVPLHSGDCRDTKFDEPWIWEVLDKYEPLDRPRTKGYVPLLRATEQVFGGRFDDVAPPDHDELVGKGADENDEAFLAAVGPEAEAEAIARQFLRHGGKRFRPFVTAAAYEAASGRDHAGGEDESAAALPLGVSRVATAIEAFHKASLVHDDIQDGDAYRYGRQATYRKYGVDRAINVGDRLIGLGYRLITTATTGDGAIDPTAAADIVDRMAKAHMRLCDGQGAEMAWRADRDAGLTPIEALRIYALKTSPGFDAALYSGVRCVGPVADELSTRLAAFARHVGVGFQIMNDLNDWRGDGDNKLLVGQDALAQICQPCFGQIICPKQGWPNESEMGQFLTQ
ncbi:MAG: DUF116 domain-containing protein [Planctomycetota bacterium]